MGDNFSTARVDCSVQKEGLSDVLIESSYITPTDITLRYTAKGSVRGDTLHLGAIKVHGVDDDFIPFRNFGF